uniref:Uncharacterized protein n=1 Tax=Ditylum brightwellii TaxID=49249 RepID=A0A6V2HJF4_9STRA|mmetsp:Transcript_10770/g.14451  ORF Transcript_10770/g.14451 Transcript_10770/m.14451 type:complete len:162 (-) Transcript_10770:29-514(-)
MTSIQRSVRTAAPLTPSSSLKSKASPATSAAKTKATATSTPSSRSKHHHRSSIQRREESSYTPIKRRETPRREHPSPSFSPSKSKSKQQPSATLAEHLDFLEKFLATKSKHAPSFSVRGDGHEQQASHRHHHPHPIPTHGFAKRKSLRERDLKKPMFRPWV